MDAINLRVFMIVIFSICLWQDGARAQNHPSDSLMLRAIFTEALSNGECHENLRVLCKEIGHRLSGSPQMDEAIAWGKKTLDGYLPDSSWLQAVQVPRWTRGDREKGGFTIGNDWHRVNVSALGGSIGTDGVLMAPVLEVKRIEDLDTMARERIEGRIVFFNRPMDPVLINTGAAYGGAYDQRSRGASAAAQYGGVAALVRSLTHALDTFPHTGGMGYEPGVPKIPAAAISTVHAQKLKEALAIYGDELTFVLEQNCRTHDDVMQANVIAELRGSTHPDEYIVVGGHLDSWDIGEGAHDDGAGIVQSIEVLRIFKALGYQPKHTLRVVLYVNEENGNRGGETYAEEARKKGERHLAAIESDSGGFSPRGFSTEADDERFEVFKSWFELFEPYSIHQARRGWSGVDIRPLKDDYVSLFGLIPDPQRYFDYHHSARDVWENVNKRELELGAAALASLVYMIDQTRLRRE
jgi:hypothetical protein